MLIKSKYVINKQSRQGVHICQGHNLVIPGQTGTGKTFLLTNIARKLINLQEMLQSLAPLDWRVTISIVCFVVDSNYF